MKTENLKVAFFKETSFLFKEWQDCLLALSISDHPKKEMDKMLRLLHTLKGNASMASFWDMTTMIHELEEEVIHLRSENYEEIQLQDHKLHLSFEKLKEHFDGLRKDLSIEEAPLNFNPYEKHSLKELAQHCDETIKFVASELDKEVHFSFEGSESELAAGIQNTLKAPLSHMLRNAVDHGVAHKGKIVISAVVTPNRFILKIRDNGKGLNSKVIFKKAHQKGVIPHEAKQSDYTDADIFQFIFLPGFSTLENSSHISGRGIGLDAAKNKIDELGGEIDIKSSAQGTTFSLIIPLSDEKKSAA